MGRFVSERGEDREVRGGSFNYIIKEYTITL